jgi:hypothetical protein
MKTLYLSATILMLFSCTPKSKKEKALPTKDSAIADNNSSHLFKNSTKCETENQVAELGIGVVIAPNEFALYDDSLLTGKPAIINSHEQYDSLNDYCTLVFEPEYAMMHFACIDKSTRAYKVLINYSQVKYLPRKEGYKFQTWEQYLLASFGVRRKTDEHTEKPKPLTLLHKAPDDHSDTLSLPIGHEMFCSMQVQGDWLKVRYNCFYNLEHDPYEGQPCHNFIHKCKDPLTAWIRWRQNNKLLVDIFLMP